jgi:ubiquinone biosynthesis protein
VQRVLAQAYGPGPLPFADFSWSPLASGTIASVHTAVLPDGRTVAVKVRRDGIAATMRADLALLCAGARVAQRLPGLRRVPVAEMTGQVGDAVHRQLDLARERVSLGELADNFAGVELVRVPRPVADFCTPCTVVMEYLPGLTAYRPGELARDDRRAVVERTLRSVYRMLFVDGLVHCDLHPGNLYLAPDTSVVILDAGFVVRLPDRVRRLFAGFFMNMAMGRGTRCADIVIESAAAIAPDCDLKGFRAGLAALVGEVHGRRAHDFSLGWFAARLFALQRRHGLYAAPEFVFPLLCLLVVEGMVNDFDSGVDFQAVAMPVLLDGLLES